ncbi:uncharacterized protein L201_005788 [Kwoniella dendrophila CBS 6074]|uniref:LsmAD domain-containing protein n=1 Tax=Kwoniella dendrophila CBS 6074 TaxID=1295534 RepID=A0AAX4JZE6_9TREE
MSNSDRGGGRGGGNRGGIRGGRGGMDNNRGKGVWRGGPPPGSISRGVSPAVPGSTSGSPAPRQSINDHMMDMKKVVHDDKNRSSKGFQTDTDISKSTGPSAERELKPWVPDATSPPPNGQPNGGNGGKDQDTFGTLVTGVPWDQFETNERLFGAKTDYQEELYTTKLNKNGADYKKREKEADRLASEIMGTVSKNSHIQEERGQVAEDSAKDEEEKYSGVVRAPGAYVPPGARRALGQGGAAPRVSAPPAPASSSAASKTNGSTAPTPAPAAPKALSPAPPPISTIAPPPAPARSTSDDPSTTVLAVTSAAVPAKPAEAPAAAPAIPTVTAPTDQKADGQLSGVVDQWRQFVGTERERAEAKKQSHLKTEREKQLAELKKFHASFKVPLPMPKDILPILAKDENKQKDIEAKAATQLEKAKEDRKSLAAAAVSSKSPIKTSAPMETAKTEQPKALPPKKPFMKIPEIPPFNAAKRKSAIPSSSSNAAAAITVAPNIPIAETAGQNIPVQATSPTPSMASLTSAANQAKLNPKANTFVFKPSAAVFKPGQPSASPATASKPLPTSSVASPAPATASLKNPFFKDKLPEKVTVDVRNDFNPWKHGSGSVPSASSIGLQWPYNAGRKTYIPSYVGGPMGGGPLPMHLGGGGIGGPGSSVFDDESGVGIGGTGSPSPHPVPSIVGGLQPYPGYGYRFNQPGLPPQFSGQMNSPMFSPGGPQFSPIPGQQQQQQQQQQQPHHQMMPGPGGPNGGHQQNGMPMYFQSGIPQNPQFLSPQHMQFNPHTPQRHGPGPGPGGNGGGLGGPQGYYPHPNVSTPHQTPQLIQHNLPPFAGQPPPPLQQQSSFHPHSPMQVNQPHPGQQQQLSQNGSGGPPQQSQPPGSASGGNGN